MSNIIKLCSQYGEIAVSGAFFRGTYCVPRTPAAGYDPGRYDGIAVMSATGQCQALFAVKYLLHPSSFLRNDEANLSPRLATIGVLPFIAIAIHYTPNPLIFYSQKNNFIISPQGEHSVQKKAVANLKKVSSSFFLQLFIMFCYC